MKLLYCMASVYNPGGMERVLLNKLRWFSERTDYELVLVTTDQHGRAPFYEFPSSVKMIDLGVNYTDDNGKNAVVKTLGYLRRRRLHKKRLAAVLSAERPDITISLYPSESSFIPSLRDGSKKVLELHLCKFFRLQYGRSGLYGLSDRLRTRQDERLVRRFDKFVVLTEEDAGYWGNLPNLEVIPNAALKVGTGTGSESGSASGYDVRSRRVIAVGRLDYQKGFDRLLEAWALLPESLRKDWHLDIYGQGEWEGMLKQMILSLGISESAAICKPTKRIFEEYGRSAFLVMSSHYEGFPMVMIEAMSCGLPVVCFDFKCGPKDIIVPGKNGFYVPEGDVAALSAKMQELMLDDELRGSMSAAAAEISQTYSEDRIMEKWQNCFKSIL